MPKKTSLNKILIIGSGPIVIGQAAEFDYAGTQACKAVSYTHLAQEIAKNTGCGMLITGENLGQVASQTAEALVVTDQSVSLPVMRPLIAMDKVDIMDKAQEIGTYETSIQPYEDCCTVFLPKHPVTKPKLDRILASESKLDCEKLIADAVASEEIVDIFPQ